MKIIPKHEERNTRNEPRAFTLIEMMVTMTVFSIGMGIVFTSIKLNEVYRSNVAVQMELYRMNKQAHDTIASELRLSSPERVNLSFPGQIRFRTPIESSENYTITWGAEGIDNREIRYNLSGVNLVRRIWNVTAGTEVSNRTIASGFTNLTFTLGCNASLTNCITIYTNATKTNFIGYNISLDARSMVALRNQ